MFVLSIAFLLLILSLSLLRLLSSFGKSGTNANLPPGSFGWPIMGETLDFLFGKPEKFVGDRMIKYSPEIFKTNILGEKTAVMCGPNGNKFLFSNEQKLFTSFRPNPMQKLLRSYQSSPPPPTSPNQDPAKAIGLPGFFKPEVLAKFLKKLDSITQQQFENWHGKDEVEVFPFAKTLTLTLSSCFFLGVNNPERIARLVHLFDHVTVGIHSITFNFPGTAFFRAKRATVALRKELLGVIKEKKNAMKTGIEMRDILSHMIVAAESTGRHMPDNEIADKIMGLLVAGYSTVATAMTFLVKYVGQRPDIYDKIREEQMEIAGAKKEGELLEWEDMKRMKYSWNAVCETMRLTPPIQGTFREALTDFTYAGYTIPKGWKIYWTVSTTNKNPTYFRDPENFEPSRFEEGETPAPYTYVPFGGGPRTCPGKEYARIAILTFLHNLMKKYKWDVLFPNEEIIGDMMPTPVKGLPVRLYEH